LLALKPGPCCIEDKVEVSPCAEEYYLRIVIFDVSDKKVYRK